MRFSRIIRLLFLVSLIKAWRPEVGLLTLQRDKDFLTSQVLVLHSNCSNISKCDQKIDCFDIIEKINRKIENMSIRMQAMEMALTKYNSDEVKALNKLNESLLGRIQTQELSNSVILKGIIQ